ncbi:MAG: carboxymuconolactone decarboxylase family protein [Syntrophotaleaceae bacterium]
MDKKTLDALARRAGCFPTTDEKDDQVKTCRTESDVKVLDAKTIELIAVGASVAACCTPCLEYHVKAALEAGASLAELATAVKMGRKVRQAPMDKVDQKAAELGI